MLTKSAGVGYSSIEMASRWRVWTTSRERMLQMPRLQKRVKMARSKLQRLFYPRGVFT